MELSDDGFETISFTSWAPLLGQWEKSDEGAKYVPSQEPERPAGILVGPAALAAGTVTAGVSFHASAEPEPQGRLAFGFDATSQAFYSAGIGGYNSLYVIDQFIPGQGWGPVRVQGDPANIERDREYQISVWTTGTWVSLAVDGIEVLEGPLPSPPAGSQVGVTAWGRTPVEFKAFQVRAQRPPAFVVMQFGEPYDALYREVIGPVCDEFGFTALRADDVFGPGIVLEDIISGIREAAVVIAEITPVNANVFYELGYAHASEKPTILLAERGHPLPFDVQGFRCIFYDNSIGGKRQVEADLRRHLAAIS